MIKKNDELIADIIDNGFEGEGIAKIENFTVFVQGAIKGEKVKIHILKVNSSFAFAKIVQIIEKSDKRVNEDCDTYFKCGGCNLRHYKYVETLELKKNIVQNLVNKSLHDKIKVNNVIGMENPFFYRNKAQYPCGLDKNGNRIIGVFANRSHNIIPFTECMIQDRKSQEIARFINNFLNEKNISVYNEEDGTGLFRHIVIKVGKKSDEIMCIIVLNGDKFKDEEILVKELVKNYPNIKTIVKNINTKNTNVILGDKNVVLYGSGYIEDKLGEYTFKISPMSFYQINPIQTEKLYNRAIQMAELAGNETIFDLYCGIGTIGIFASKYVKKVYGIEIVPEAIEDAKENARINGIQNIDFFAGDVEKLLPDLLEKQDVSCDIVFFDPPRKGLDVNTINNIINVKPKKIVYISCNPATLVRDLKVFEDTYNIEEIQPVDMFPFTSHTETIAVLNLKQ